MKFEERRELPAHYYIYGQSINTVYNGSTLYVDFYMSAPWNPISLCRYVLYERIYIIIIIVKQTASNRNRHKTQTAKLAILKANYSYSKPLNDT